MFESLKAPTTIAHHLIISGIDRCHTHPCCDHEGGRGEERGRVEGAPNLLPCPEEEVGSGRALVVDRTVHGGVCISPERSYGSNAVDGGAMRSDGDRPPKGDYSVCVDLKGWEGEVE